MNLESFTPLLETGKPDWAYSRRQQRVLNEWYNFLKQKKATRLHLLQRYGRAEAKDSSDFSKFHIRTPSRPHWSPSKGVGHNGTARRWWGEHPDGRHGEAEQKEMSEGNGERTKVRIEWRESSVPGQKINRKHVTYFAWTVAWFFGVLKTKIFTTSVFFWGNRSPVNATPTANH